MDVIQRWARISKQKHILGRHIFLYMKNENDQKQQFMTYIL